MYTRKELLSYHKSYCTTIPFFEQIFKYSKALMHNFNLYNDLTFI